LQRWLEAVAVLLSQRFSTSRKNSSNAVPVGDWRAISDVEDDIYQVKNQSGQDPLNFPIKINNRLANLNRS
jgi:hypothetical protein